MNCAVSSRISSKKKEQLMNQYDKNIELLSHFIWFSSTFGKQTDEHVVILNIANISKLFVKSTDISFIMPNDHVFSYSECLSILDDLKLISAMNVNITINFEWTEEFRSVNRSRINEYLQQLHTMKWITEYTAKSISFHCKYSNPANTAYVQQYIQSTFSTKKNKTETQNTSTKNPYVPNSNHVYYGYDMFLIEAYIRRHVSHDQYLKISQDIKHYVLRLSEKNIGGEKFPSKADVTKSIKDILSSKYGWSKVPIKTRSYDNKYILELAITTHEFVKDVKKALAQGDINILTTLVFNDDEINQKLPIPILQQIKKKKEKNNASDDHCEYVCIVNLSEQFDIGVSFRPKYNWQQVTGIYLNKIDILNHLVLLWPHDVNYLDTHTFDRVDMLYIGNPDNQMNRIKALQKRLKSVHQRISVIKSGNSQKEETVSRCAIQIVSRCHNNVAFARNIPAKHNIQIPKKLTNKEIPNRVKEVIPDAFDYISKMVALQRQDSYTGKIRILNCELNDKNTNQILYCIAYSRNATQRRNFEWIMDKKLYTLAEIKQRKELQDFPLPELPRKLHLFETQINRKQDIEIAIQEYASGNRFSRINWTNILIDNQQNNKRRITFKITEAEFIKQITEYTLANGADTLPIVVFDEEYNPNIEHVQIIRIADRFNIGISYKFNTQNNFCVQSIYLTKSCILNKHILAMSHDCNCLQNFTQLIDVLIIGDLEYRANQIKHLSHKLQQADKQLQEAELQQAELQKVGRQLQEADRAKHSTKPDFHIQTSLHQTADEITRDFDELIINHQNLQTQLLAAKDAMKNQFQHLIAPSSINASQDQQTDMHSITLQMNTMLQTQQLQQLTVTQLGTITQKLIFAQNLILAQSGRFYTDTESHHIQPAEEQEEQSNGVNVVMDEEIAAMLQKHEDTQEMFDPTMMFNAEKQSIEDAGTTPSKLLIPDDTGNTLLPIDEYPISDEKLQTVSNKCHQVVSKNDQSNDLQVNECIEIQLQNDQWIFARIEAIYEHDILVATEHGKQTISKIYARNHIRKL
eukprot:447140_1